MLGQRSILCSVLASLATLVVAPAGSYGLTPRASLTVAPTVDAGSRAAFTWAVKNRPPRSRIVLQRAMGQSHVFRTLRTLPSAKGNGALPPYSIGRYVIRIAIIDRHRRRVGASKSQILKVYGSVPLAKLCGALTETDTLFGCPKSGTTQASGHVFEYAATIGADSNGIPGTALTSPRTTCRDLSLQFAFAFSDERQTPKIDVSLVQRSLDAQTVTVTQGELGALTAPLDGGPWQLNTQADKNYYAGSFSLGLNGTATCYTQTGV